jgi:hypothetical protein
MVGEREIIGNDRCLFSHNIYDARMFSIIENSPIFLVGERLLAHMVLAAISAFEGVFSKRCVSIFALLVILKENILKFISGKYSKTISSSAGG